MHGDRSAVNLNWGLINSHYLHLPDKWNDLLSSCWKFNEIPANSKHSMWKMDKFGEHLGLESHRMEHKGVPPILWIYRLLQIVAFLVAVTTLCQFYHSNFLSTPRPQRRQSLIFPSPEIHITVSLECLTNAQDWGMSAYRAAISNTEHTHPRWSYSDDLLVVRVNYENCPYYFCLIIVRFYICNF